MSRINLLCEGITDQFFLADCLELLYGIKFTKSKKLAVKDKFEVSYLDKINIIDVGGCSNLYNQIYTSMIEDNADGINIVIFDADRHDSNEGNNGFNNCSTKLSALKQRKNLNFEYFIWPNNADDGEIEDLLRLLIPKNKEEIFKCIDNHVTCLESLTQNLRVLQLKEKVNFYLYMSNQKSELQNRDYKIKDHWEMDFESNEALKVLKDFLNSHLKDYLS